MEKTFETPAESSLRGWSYKGALDAGLELKSYAWEDVPTGTWLARLDFKVWSNKTSAGSLGCYFTSLADGRRYLLSAFRFPSLPLDRKNLYTNRRIRRLFIQRPRWSGLYVGDRQRGKRENKMAFSEAQRVTLEGSFYVTDRENHIKTSP